MADDSFEIVARFLSSGEAQISISALHAAGIPAVLQDEHTVGIQWLYAQAIGGVKILVPTGDVDRALEILTVEAVESGLTPLVATTPPPRGDSMTEERTPSCPVCGSENVSDRPRLPVFLLGALLLYGVGMAIGEEEMMALAVGVLGLILILVGRYRCRECGEQWSIREVERREGVEGEPEERSRSVHEEEACPRCGSPDWSRAGFRRFKAATLLFSPLVALLPFLRRRECNACGHRW